MWQVLNLTLDIGFKVVHKVKNSKGNFTVSVFTQLESPIIALERMKSCLL